MSKYTVNMNLIKTPEFAYILGYLWADGAFIEKDQKIAMQLQKRDVEEIRHLLELTGDWNIKDYWKQTSKIQEKKCYPMIYARHKEFSDFLLEKDFKNKTLGDCRGLIEFLGQDLLHYFVRGYFDGDGCVYVNKSKYVSFTASHNKVWTSIIKLLDDLNIEYRLVKSKKPNGNFTEEIRIISYQSILKFANFIYSGRIFGLLRKRNKFLTIIENAIIEKQRESSISFYSKIKRFVCRFYEDKKVHRVGSFMEVEDAFEAMWLKHKELNTKQYQTFKEILKLSGNLQFKHDYIRQIAKFF
jgi:intein/homing endonuclease